MGIEIRLRDLLADSPAASAWSRTTPRAIPTLDWARKFFEISDLPKFISWEEFDRKGYYIINVPEDYKSTPALRWFAEGRACDTPDPSNPKAADRQRGHELGTDSGKIEFVSQSLQALRARRRRAAAGAALSAELGRPSLARRPRDIRCS